jgi:hypothetical protein
MHAALTIVAWTVVMAAAASGPAQTSKPPNPISQAIRESWDGAKRNLVESAAQMPEPEYAFRPVDSVRTFGQIVAHVAGANYVFCSAAKPEPTPFSEDHFEKTTKTKAEIVKALNDSVAYCDAVLGALNDASAAAPITMPFGMGSKPRGFALIGNIGHVQEHYGNLVTYFRIKGMVPPSSRR